MNNIDVNENWYIGRNNHTDPYKVNYTTMYVCIFYTLSETKDIKVHLI